MTFYIIYLRGLSSLRTISYAVYDDLKKELAVMHFLNLAIYKKNFKF